MSAVWLSAPCQTSPSHSTASLTPSSPSLTRSILLCATSTWEESLAFDDMKAVLEGSGFAAEGHLVQLVLDVLKRTDLLQADDNQRWTLRPDVKDSVRRCPNPSVPQKFQSLAEQMRAWGRNADQRLRW